MKQTIIILSFFLTVSQVFAQKTHQQLLKADELFAKEQYDQAATVYGEVAKEGDKPTESTYNQGVAEAKAGQKKEALGHFAQAAELADNQHDRASSLYNAGTLLLSEKNQLDQSIKVLKEALRNSPTDMDIRKNLAKAIQLKRQQQRQQQKNKKDQDQKKNKDQQNKDQQNNDEKDQQNKDQQKQDEKDDKNKQNKDQQNKESKDQKKQQKQPEQDQQKQPEQDQQKQNDAQPQDGSKPTPKNPAKKPMSIQQRKALQKLKAVENAERRVRKKLQKKKGKSHPRSGKNW